MYLSKKRSLAISAAVGLRVATVQVLEADKNLVVIEPVLCAWSEGRKVTYALVDMRTARAVELNLLPDPFASTESVLVELPLNVGLVTVESNGDSKTVTLTLRKENMPQEPAKIANRLTWDEVVVLYITRGIVSSQRESEARRVGVNAYHEVKQALIDKGLLNKVGALSLDGRNAIQHVSRLPSRKEYEG